MNNGQDGTKGWALVENEGIRFGLEVSWGVSASERLMLLTRIFRCTAVVQIVPLSESTLSPDERPAVHVHH